MSSSQVPAINLTDFMSNNRSGGQSQGRTLSDVNKKPPEVNTCSVTLRSFRVFCVLKNVGRKGGKPLFTGLNELRTKFSQLKSSSVVI